MNKMVKRIGGLMALAVTAGVSMLAGGVLLGGAYADGGNDSPPTFVTHRLGDGEATFSAGTGCIVNIRADGSGEMPKLVTGSVGIAGLPAGDGVAVPAFSIASGGGSIEGEPIEIRALPPEKVAELEAKLAELRVNAEAGECTVVEGTFEGMLTAPSGALKFVPATKVE